MRDNEGILSDKEDSGGVQAIADAVLASLLNAQLDSFSPARVTLYDPEGLRRKSMVSFLMILVMPGLRTILLQSQVHRRALL